MMTVLIYCKLSAKCARVKNENRSISGEDMDKSLVGCY